MKNYSQGLKHALNKVPHGEIKRVVEDLMKILGVTTKSAFWYYQTGRKIPRADEAQEIIEYFKKKHIDVYE